MRALPVAALLVLTVLALACGRSGNASVEVTADGSPIPTATPTPTNTETTEPDPDARPPTPTPTPEAVRLDLEDLRGFVHPVPGACLPFADQLMPNAPRLYRNGVHEGVDIYPGYACAYVERGTPVVAMFDGVVLRADLDYVEITLAQVNELAAAHRRAGVQRPGIARYLPRPAGVDRPRAGCRDALRAPRVHRRWHRGRRRGHGGAGDRGDRRVRHARVGHGAGHGDAPPLRGARRRHLPGRWAPAGPGAGNLRATVQRRLGGGECRRAGAGLPALRSRAPATRSHRSPGSSVCAPSP